MNYRAYVAEFVGTFALCWVGIYAIHHFAGQSGGLVGIALAHGITIAVLASATMAVSGGHLNPAVTVAMLMTKRIKVVDGLAYILSQLLGALAAAKMVVAVPIFATTSAPDAIEAAWNKAVGTDVVWSGTPNITEALHGNTLMGSSVAQSAMILEAIATFFLVFVILGTAVDKRAPKVGGLYIGLAVTIGILAIGPFTGAALNPARWLGPALVGNVRDHVDVVPMNGLMMAYVIGPILGGILAAIVFQLFIATKEQLAEEAAA